MWRHYCKPNRGWLMVGKGEPCNWCPAEPPPAEEEEPTTDATKGPSNG
jgi:hypothetical protein